jgi:hypothetical protein
VIFGSTLELDPWKDVDWDPTYQLVPAGPLLPPVWHPMTGD